MQKTEAEGHFLTHSMSLAFFPIRNPDKILEERKNCSTISLMNRNEKFLNKKKKQKNKQNLAM